MSRLAKLAPAALLLALAGHATAEAPPSTPSAEQTWQAVAEARRSGDDARAAELLEAAVGRLRPGRRQAELGLAYLGADRPVDAERALEAALETRDEAWVVEHRAGLELALSMARERLGWLEVACNAPGLRVIDPTGDAPSSACGHSRRVRAGELELELRAPDRLSERVHVTVRPGEHHRLRPALSLHDCDAEGMMHAGGAGGVCCWPDQRVVEGACRGAPTCPADTRPEANACVDTGHGRGLATLAVGGFAGVAGFLSPDTGLFRAGVDASGSSTRVGARFELRVAARLYGPLDAALIIGGSRQDVNRWLECGDTSGCVDTGPTAYGIDLGLMLRLHTNPRRRLGAFDLHLGLGVRPFARLVFDSADAGRSSGKLTATVLPAELGVSLYLGRAVSIDLVGQGELWLPREYCGEAPDGSRSCTGSGLEHELAGAALLGLTLHLGG